MIKHSGRGAGTIPRSRRGQSTRTGQNFGRAELLSLGLGKGRPGFSHHRRGHRVRGRPRNGPWGTRLPRRTRPRARRSRTRRDGALRHGLVHRFARGATFRSMRLTKVWPATWAGDGLQPLLQSLDARSLPILVGELIKNRKAGRVTGPRATSRARRKGGPESTWGGPSYDEPTLGAATEARWGPAKDGTRR